MEAEREKEPEGLLSSDLELDPQPRVAACPALLPSPKGLWGWNVWVC